MEKYDDLYPFDVLEAVRQGRKVYMLDKLELEVNEVFSMEIREFFLLLDYANRDKTNRYAFWAAKEDDQDEHDTV